MSDSVKKALEHFSKENELLKLRLNKTKDALKRALLIENGGCPSSAGLNDPPYSLCSNKDFTCDDCRTQAVDKI